MHLTRSVTAMVGSLLGLYTGLPKTDMIQDLLQILLLFPSRLGLEIVVAQRGKMVRSFAQSLPPFIRPASPDVVSAA